MKCGENWIPHNSNPKTKLNNYTLEETDGAIKNGKFRDTGSKTQNEDTQNTTPHGNLER